MKDRAPTPTTARGIESPRPSPGPLPPIPWTWPRACPRSYRRRPARRPRPTPMGPDRSRSIRVARPTGICPTRWARSAWSPTLPGPVPPPTPMAPSARPVSRPAHSPTRSASAARGPLPSRAWSSCGPAPTIRPPAPSSSVTAGASPPPTASRSTPTPIPPTIRLTRWIRAGTIPGVRPNRSIESLRPCPLTCCFCAPNVLANVPRERRLPSSRRRRRTQRGVVGGRCCLGRGPASVRKDRDSTARGDQRSQP